MKHIAILTMIASILGFTSNLQAQTHEEQFQDIFVTAGYATAFGAALGVAGLALTENPQDNLSYIFKGASLGFISGSVMGAYVVINPVMVEKKTDKVELMAENMIPKKGFALQPTFTKDLKSLVGVEAGFTLSTF